MPAYFDRGVLTASSWHGLEVNEPIPNADAMIARGIELGAYPRSVELKPIHAFTPRGVIGLPDKGVIADYADRGLVGLGTVGNRYTPTDPRSFQDLIRACWDVGCKGIGAFSLYGGTKILATFEVFADHDLGLRQYLTLCDDLVGRGCLSLGDNSLRVLCANTLSGAMSQDGNRWAKIRHCGDMAAKCEALGVAVAATIETGKTVAETYRNARETPLHTDDLAALIDQLVPMPQGDRPSKSAITRANNDRRDLVIAMSRPENLDNGRSLATLWNAATWNVDRTANGLTRKTRGNSDALGSLLFGSRAKRIATIESTINGWLSDAVATVPAATVSA